MRVQVVGIRASANLIEFLKIRRADTLASNYNSQLVILNTYAIRTYRESYLQEEADAMARNTTK